MLMDYVNEVLNWPNTLQGKVHGTVQFDHEIQVLEESNVRELYLRARQIMNKQYLEEITEVLLLNKIPKIVHSIEK